MKKSRLRQEQIQIHVDEIHDDDDNDNDDAHNQDSEDEDREDEDREDEDRDTVMTMYRDRDESRRPDDSDGLESEDSEEEVEEAVADDMLKFESTFKGIGKRYRLINRIGEGTFSTVYKAEDLHYHTYRNEWDLEERENSKWSAQSRSRGNGRQPARYVAIKKIYVTSSPIRIFNELDLLHDLRASDSVCPLITAFRHQDQVIAVLPYFQHRDFREYFRDMTVSDMRLYFKSLFTALAAVHCRDILHRDIKPTNFLYNPAQSRGVLVDFGLAEREGTDWQSCACNMSSRDLQHRYHNSVHAQSQQADPTAQVSYPKSDTRPSRRANRAGTRGFRAPEVLLKCTQQTHAIDMWSAGVILLTLMSRRFPFFHSADDIDALLELTNIFGSLKMKQAALLHGQVFETNIPSYSEKGHSLEKIILWCTNRTQKDADGKNRVNPLTGEEREAVDFLERCLECDPRKRITAEQALQHRFITSAGMEASDDDVVELVDSSP